MEILLGLVVIGILTYVVWCVVRLALLTTYDIAGNGGLLGVTTLAAVPLVWMIYKCLVEFPNLQQACFAAGAGAFDGNGQLRPGQSIPDCESAGDMFVYMFGGLAILGLAILGAAVLSIIGKQTTSTDGEAA